MPDLNPEDEGRRLFGNGVDDENDDGDNAGDDDNGNGKPDNQGGNDGDEQVDFDQLPESVQKYIRKLRREAAGNRVARRDSRGGSGSSGGNDRGRNGGNERGTGSSRNRNVSRVAGNRRNESQDDEVDLDQVREEARHEARMEHAEDLAAARIEAALTGLVSDPGDVVEDLNLRRFVTDDGKVDAEEVAILKAKYAKLAGKRVRDRGNGRQGDTTGKTGTAKEQFEETMKGLF